MSIEIINADCLSVLPKIRAEHDNIIIVSDPPFNIGYHYDDYKDNLSDDEYANLMYEVFAYDPCVVIHYPEELYKIAFNIGKFPERVVSWVYNSNTRRQHRDIAFFDIMPDFSKVKQPYKNPDDKRVQKLIADGRGGADLYDWWNINMVKNINKNKRQHPCQMPLKVMENIIGILPETALIIDPFMGSGTTGVACKNLGRDFIGIELSKAYFDIAQDRLNNICANGQISIFAE